MVKERSNALMYAVTMGGIKKRGVKPRFKVQFLLAECQAN